MVVITHLYPYAPFPFPSSLCIYFVKVLLAVRRCVAIPYGCFLRRITALLQTIADANMSIEVASPLSETQMISPSDGSTSTMQLARSPSDPKLPTEVCERIIDFVAHFSRLLFHPALLNVCTLTCRAWLPRNRFHLYHAVVIWDAQYLEDLWMSSRATLP